MPLRAESRRDAERPAILWIIAFVGTAAKTTTTTFTTESKPTNSKANLSSPCRGTACAVVVGDAEPVRRNPRLNDRSKNHTDIILESGLFLVGFGSVYLCEKSRRVQGYN